MSTFRIAHIINPVHVPPSSDLFEAQPVTFRTMLKAKNDSEHSENISQYVIGYPEDEVIYPKGFIWQPPMERSVLETGTFEKNRKLPLIADILNSLSEADVDYIIYTNVDIAVMPFFYDYIFDRLESGSDTLIINRRVVETLRSDAVMFAEIGKSHPGYDCFVFRKELLSKFKFGHTCIGANWIGRAMYTNLLVFSKSLEVVKDAHLTYHIGEDGAWLVNDFSEFDTHNKKEVYALIRELGLLDLSEDKKKTLDGVLHFMDNFTLGPKPKSPPKKKPILYRIARKMKRTLVSIFK